MISKPTLLLNKYVCLQNIQVMVQKAKKSNAKLRPHFKTHQSKEIGRWFQAAGINKITVSSLTMANYFSEDGWRDITVATPVNVLEIEIIKSLSANITLNLVVESKEVVRFLDSNLKNTVNCFIKLDTGYGRAGIGFDQTQSIHQLARIIAESNHLNFVGLLAHEGHSYSARGKEELVAIHQQNIKNINVAASPLLKDFPTLIRSVGSTPVCGGLDSFEGADEVRPGNFVFFDCMQQQIGSCCWGEVAVALACPIIVIHESKNEIIIYGGGVHFSKDYLTLEDETICYGQVVEPAPSGWGRPVPGAIISKLSQEHGTVSAPSDFVKNCAIGDLLYVLPVHSCMTANVMKGYTTLDGETISIMSNV